MRNPTGRRFLLGAPRVTPVTGWLMGLSAGVFLLYLFTSASTRAHLVFWLALTPASLLDGHVWKLATASLLNISGLAFFFDMLMLWLFVPVLEQYWGSRRFLVFVLAASLVANLAAALVGLALAPNTLVVGLSAFIYASIAAYGTLFSDRPVQLFGVLPIRGKVLALGTAAFVTLFVLLEGAWVAGAGYFAAMGLGWLMTSGAWSPNVWWLRYRHWRLRRRYKVLDGGASRTSQNRWMN